MSKIPSPHFQMESWAIVFSISSLINFGIVYIWPIHQSLEKSVRFTISFFSSQRELHSVRNIDFFVKLWLILSQLELSRIDLPKCAPNMLMQNCGHTTCPVLSILFYITQPIRLGFWKVYLWARNFL